MNHEDHLNYLDLLCRIARLEVSKTKLHKILLLNELVIKKQGEADLRDVSKLISASGFDAYEPKLV